MTTFAHRNTSARTSLVALSRPITCTMVGLFGGVVALVWLVRASGLILDLGGACTSDNAYVVATPCPGSAAVLLPVAILGGALCWLLYTLLGLKVGPRVTALVWPAVFLSLAWQFAVHGVGPRAYGGQPVWAFLACAAVFVSIGGVPLVPLIHPAVRRRILWTTYRAGGPRRVENGRTDRTDDRVRLTRLEMVSVVLLIDAGATALILGSWWFDAAVTAS